MAPFHVEQRTGSAVLPRWRTFDLSSADDPGRDDRAVHGLRRVRLLRRAYGHACTARKEEGVSPRP